MSGTAVLISTRYPKGADQRCYRCTPPLDGHEYVVVSAITTPFGSEAYIFAANDHGTITNWVELVGSCKGSLNHEWALTNAGYTIRATA